ncbi:MAG: hypothetical protein HY841_09025 [Bacteroidetes bacterium]|nr:hypothetical protein [Bacteroidota bacterium]
MSKYIIICFLFLFSFERSFGAPVSPADTSELGKSIALGFENIYNFKFSKADSLADELKKKYPEERKIYLLIANSCWWKIRSGEDNAANRKQFMSALTTVESMLDKKKKNELSYEDLFNYINVYSYMARLELLGDNYFKAFSFINKCGKYLFASFGKEQFYEPFNLTTGLYSYNMIAARKKYPPLIPFLLMLPSADKTLGIKLLAKCSESSDNIIQTEGQYFLMIIYGEGDVNYTLSEAYAEKLSSRYPQNLLYRYYLFRLLLQDNKKELAMKQYKLLYQSSLANKELTELQRKHFISLAQKDLEEYYKKHSSEESKN